MIDIAFGLQKSTKDALFDPFVLSAAQEVLFARDMDEAEFVQVLFDYSARLAAVATTLAGEVLMTETQIDSLLNTIRELDSIDELGQDF